VAHAEAARSIHQADERVPIGNRNEDANH
jgi:hypothetical protein